jgi:hypothetical protein
MGQLLVDTGSAGFGFRVCIWVTYFVETFKHLRNLSTEASQNNTTVISMRASLAVLALLASGFFESRIYDSQVTMLLYFLMGLSLAQVKNFHRRITIEKIVSWVILWHFTKIIPVFAVKN